MCAIKLFIDLKYRIVNKNLCLKIIDIIEAIIIHEPSIKPINPHELKLEKYDCNETNALSIKKKNYINSKFFNFICFPRKYWSNTH